jgi:putative ABC transport system permease protein
MITGYVLVYVFKTSSPYLTVFILFIMEAFSIMNIIKRSKQKLSKSLKKIVALSIILGNTLCLLYFLFVVIRISPWYNPQYFISIAGMLIGNSMTGVSLGLNTMNNSFSKEKSTIDAYLMLGASKKEATKHIINNAFDSAILPTINSMLGIGIVSLPGMMTGQILAGTSPLIAIEYQIAIMLGILGSVSLSVILFLQLGYKTYFNSDLQLISE